MTKQNKAPQDVRKHRLVDIAKVYTPSEYAEANGYSRQYVYYMMEVGLIKPENVFKRKGGTLIVAE
jgi:hypothetical protein